MNITVTAEYDCEHPPKVIISGDWSILRAELLRLGGEVSFDCPRCGGGSTGLVLEQNGKMIRRFSPLEMVGLPGATVTVKHRTDRN